MHFPMVELYQPGALENHTSRISFLGCPEGHDWSVLAETCRSKNIAIFTVACRNDLFTQKAFSAIAASSGGQCTKIEVKQVVYISCLDSPLIQARRLPQIGVESVIEVNVK